MSDLDSLTLMFLLLDSVGLLLNQNIKYKKNMTNPKDPISTEYKLGTKIEHAKTKQCF